MWWYNLLPCILWKGWNNRLFPLLNKQVPWKCIDLHSQIFTVCSVFAPDGDKVAIFFLFLYPEWPLRDACTLHAITHTQTYPARVQGRNDARNPFILTKYTWTNTKISFTTLVSVIFNIRSVKYRFCSFTYFGATCRVIVLLILIFYHRNSISYIFQQIVCELVVQNRRYRFPNKPYNLS